MLEDAEITEQTLKIDTVKSLQFGAAYGLFSLSGARNLTLSRFWGATGSAVASGGTFAGIEGLKLYFDPDVNGMEAVKQALAVGVIAGGTVGLYSFVTGRGVSGKKFESEEILAALRKYDAELAARAGTGAQVKFADAFRAFLKNKPFALSRLQLLRIIAQKAPQETAVKFLQRTILKLNKRELDTVVAAMVEKNSAFPAAVTKEVMPQIIAKARGPGLGACRRNRL